MARNFEVAKLGQYLTVNTSAASINVAANLVVSGISANGGFGTSGQALLSNGTATYWGNVATSGGPTLVANTTDANTFYIPLSNATSGSWTNGVISSTKLYFIPSTGTLNATIFNSLSDATYKTDIEKIDNGLDVLKMLEGVSFKWKETGNKSYGVVAQEIEKILPDVVSESKEGVKSVNYMAIIGFLIEAIKELNSKIEGK